MSKKTIIDYQGRKVEGQEMSFKAEQEGWNQYRLEDGNTVRVRVVVTDVIKTKEKAPNGEPLVIVKSALLVNYREERGKPNARRGGRRKRQNTTRRSHNG
jgi:hypothetical protein